MREGRSGAARLALAVLLLALVLGTAVPGPAATLETLQPRPGVTERFILLPARGAAPAASVILLIGGNGRVGLTPENIDKPFNNFLARTRGLFAERGLQVALLDSPSDHRELGDWRMSADHAADIAAVIRFLHQKADVPVWLVGTSRGTVSAASAASLLATAPAASRPDGIVLTSTVTIAARRQPTSVYSAALDAIAVPVLIVHHRADACAFSPFGAVDRLSRSFPKSPKVETLVFEGGDRPRSDACEPFAPHGYLGIEAKVVDATAVWIKTNGPHR